MTALIQQFQALGDKTRFALVMHLAKGPSRVSDLSQPFAISAPAISRHLRILETAGLIERQVQAQNRIIRLKPEGFIAIRAWAGSIEAFWQQSFDKLDVFLQGDKQHDTNQRPDHRT